LTLAMASVIYCYDKKAKNVAKIWRVASVLGYTQYSCIVQTSNMVKKMFARYSGAPIGLMGLRRLPR